MKKKSIKHTIVPIRLKTFDPIETFHLCMKLKPNRCSKTAPCLKPKITSVVCKSRARVGLYHKCGILNLQME